MSIHGRPRYDMHCCSRGDPDAAWRFGRCSSCLTRLKLGESVSDAQRTAMPLTARQATCRNFYPHALGDEIIAAMGGLVLLGVLGALFTVCCPESLKGGVPCRHLHPHALVGRHHPSRRGPGAAGRAGRGAQWSFETLILRNKGWFSQNTTETLPCVPFRHFHPHALGDRHHCSRGGPGAAGRAGCAVHSVLPPQQGPRQGQPLWLPSWRLQCSGLPSRCATPHSWPQQPMLTGRVM